MRLSIISTTLILVSSALFVYNEQPPSLAASELTCALRANACGLLELAGDREQVLLADESIHQNRKSTKRGEDGREWMHATMAVAAIG